MSSLLTSRFWGARLPFLFIGVVCALNAIAILLMPPPGDPPAISFKSGTVQAREGKEAKLVIRISPPSRKKLKVGLLPANFSDDLLWNFGTSPLLSPQGIERVVEIPAGHDEVTILLLIKDDKIERENPGRLTFNLKHLGSHTVSGEFRSIDVSVRDPYVQPVVMFGIEEAVEILEGKMKTIPVTATGTVEKTLSIPLAIVGDTPADLELLAIDVVRINAGESSGVIHLKAIKDALYEGDEGAAIQILSEGDDFAVGDNSELKVTVIDSDQKPQFTINMPKLVVQHNEDAIVQLHASVAADEPQQVEVSVAVLSEVPKEIRDLLPGKLLFAMPEGKKMIEKVAFDASVPWPRGYHQLEFGVQDSRQSITVTYAPVELRVDAKSRDENDPTAINVIAKLPPGTSAISDNEIMLQGSGTATLGDDYTVLGEEPSRAGDTWNLRLVIPEGQNASRISLRINDDVVHEGDEEIRLELVEALTGLDEIRSANVLIHDDEKMPRLTLRASKKKLFEGDEAKIELQIPEGQPESSRPIRGKLRPDPDSSAQSGKHYKIEDTELVIPPGKRSAKTKLRVVDDQKADRGPPKKLKLAIHDVQNATADGPPLELTINDNDTWLGERLVLIAWTEDLDRDPQMREAIDAFQIALSPAEKDKLVGGDIQCVDANLNQPMAWGKFLEEKVNKKLLKPFNALDTGKVLGAAQVIEQQIAKLRPPVLKFETFLIYPINSGSDRSKSRFIYEKPVLGNERFIWVIGRDDLDDDGDLKADLETYTPDVSTVDEWKKTNSILDQFRTL